MKFNSWPAPPIHSLKEIPEIPEHFKIFGLDYKVVNGNPQLDIPSKPLDINHMKECIDKSLALFIKTLRSFDSAFINELRDLHSHINEEINLAKEFDKPNVMQESKNKKIIQKKEIIQKIKDCIEK